MSPAMNRVITHNTPHLHPSSIYPNLTDGQIQLDGLMEHDMIDPFREQV